LPRPIGGAGGPPMVNGAIGQIQPAGTHATMTGADVWRVIRSNMWLIVGSLVAAGVLGFAANWYLARFHAKYTSIGFVQIQTPQNYNPLGTPVRDSVYDNTTLQIDQRTNAQVLRSFSLHTQILQDPNSAIRKTQWFKDFLIKQKQPDGTFREVLDDADAKVDLQDSFDASPIPDSRLIQVSMTYKLASDCKTIVEEIVTRHLQQQAKILNDKTEERSLMLRKLKTGYEAKLRDLKDDTYAKLAKLNAAGAGSPNGYFLNPKDVELSKLVEGQMRLQQIYSEAASQYDEMAKSMQRGETPGMVGRYLDQDIIVQRARGAVSEIEQQIDQYKAFQGESSSTIQRLQKNLELAQKRQKETEDAAAAQAGVSLLESLKLQVSSTKADLDTQTKKVDDLKAEQAELASTRAEYLSLKDEIDTYTELMNTVQKQLDTISGSQLINANQITWAQKPETPDTRSFPKLSIVMSIAVALGLFLSLGIAFLREMLDTTVRSPRDIARVGQMNLLGMIPHDEDDPQSAGTPLPLVIFQAPHSMIAEQFRQVRTRLQHAASLDTTRSILVTSPEPGDGKSTVATNLAAGLALNGRRILLVDANFRRPELQNIFGVANDVGFSNVLASLDNFENAVRQSQVPNLDVLTSGPKPANATELMESQLLVDFIERALEEYDHVIFDSGPMLFVSETVALAPRVDGVVTVVRARTNTRGLLQRMRDGLRQLKAEHLGVVLNGVRSQGGGYYGRNIRTYYEYQNLPVPVGAAR
jgi:capsular exopolysaccharide synthesis family protein